MNDYSTQSLNTYPFSEIILRKGSKVISFSVVVTFRIKKPPEGGQKETMIHCCELVCSKQFGDMQDHSRIWDPSCPL